MNKALKEVYFQAVLLQPNSKYSRYCKFCKHRIQFNDNNHYCMFYDDDCVDVLHYKLCPIPEANVSMLMESALDFATRYPDILTFAKPSGNETT